LQNDSQWLAERDYTAGKKTCASFTAAQVSRVEMSGKLSD